MKTIYGTTDVEINGVQQIAAGGTGATTAAAALTALGAAPASHTHAIADTTGLQAALVELSSPSGVPNALATPLSVYIDDFSDGISLNLNGNKINGRNSYGPSFPSGNYSAYTVTVQWNGTAWQMNYQSPNSFGARQFFASGDTLYPWEATWGSDVSGDFGGVEINRSGTYDASLAAKPLAAEASSGTGTKAAREDHVHPLPPNFTGSNGTSAGTAGLVPLPAATDNTKFLKGDGTWADTGAQALPSYETLDFTVGFFNNIRQLSARRNIVYRTPSSWSSPFIRILRLPQTDCRAGDRVTILVGYVPPNSSIVIQKLDSAVGWVDMAEVIGGSSGNNNPSRLVFVTDLGTVNGNANWDAEPVFIGATSISRGSSGLVPAPFVADRTKFLKGDGSWADTPSATPNSLSIGTVNTGAAGSSASASITGTAPSQTLSLTIPRGDKGDTGNNGTAATVAVGTVNTGNAGSSASVTNVGTTSAAVLDFTIPRGNAGTNGTAVLSGPGNPLTTQGAVGDFYINTTTNFIFGPKPNASAWGSSVSLVGPAGTDGTNGTAATVAVGTVSTGTAGSAAAVTNSGTSSAAVLNFTVPRGANGLAGPSIMLKIAGSGVGQWPSFGTLPNANTQPSVEYLFPWNFVEYNGDSSLYDADPTNIARNIRINASPAGEWFLIAARYASFDLNATNHFMRVRLRSSTSAITTATAGSLEALIAQTRTITATNGEAFVAGQVPIRLFGTTFLALTFLHDGPVGFPVNNNDAGTQPFIYITKLGN
jgi:hypothetical protein